jgi:predicted RNase H-like HicB family nuclease
MVRTMNKYAIEIFFSEEDKGYIAIVPELPGCSAFGKTEEKALEEIKISMELWLETAEKEGKKLPKPIGKELFKEFYERNLATRSIQ